MAILASQILNLALLIFGTEPEPAQPRDRATCQGDVILPGYYQDGAVFQSGKPSQVWGFTTTRECSIFVTQVCGKGYNKISYAATGDFELDPSGGERYLWKVRLPARLSGEECVLNAKQGNSIKSVSVVYGDVYVCSGQSNMEFAMGSIANASSEMNLSKDYSNIRMFKVPHAYSPLAQEDIYPLAGNAWFDPSDQWRLSRFSAVCFLYARYLTDEFGDNGPNGTKKIFGLIQSTWGGTRVEAWTPQYALDPCGVSPYTDRQTPANSNSWLFNAMIHPLLRQTIFGVLWYQGESNTNWNKNLYSCTFRALIENWRLSWVRSGSDPYLPFGFVHLGNFINGQDGVDIRWHQTFDKGFVNGTVDKRFMAVAMDTYDKKGGIHPRNKQIVAKRLSIAGANVAYNVQSNPTNGPFPTELSIQPGAAVTVTYDQEFTYDNSEISGFSICCKDYSECDYYQDAWKVLDRYHGKKDSSTSIMVNIQDVCGQNSPTGLAYLWEDTPTKRMIGLPIYSNDRFQLPAAPWKYELDKTPKF